MPEFFHRSQKGEVQPGYVDLMHVVPSQTGPLRITRSQRAAEALWIWIWMANENDDTTFHDKLPRLQG